MRHWNKSLHQIDNQQKTPHGLSYPQIPSRRGRQLLSVRSEGAATAGESLEVGNFSAVAPPVQMLPTEITEKHPDDSSDESAAEDVIVRVDSPSHLSLYLAH